MEGGSKRRLSEESGSDVEHKRQKAAIKSEIMNDQYQSGDATSASASSPRCSPSCHDDNKAGADASSKGYAAGDAALKREQDLIKQEDPIKKEDPAGDAAPERKLKDRFSSSCKSSAANIKEVPHGEQEKSHLNADVSHISAPDQNDRISLSTAAARNAAQSLLSRESASASALITAQASLVTAQATLDAYKWVNSNEELGEENMRKRAFKIGKYAAKLRSEDENRVKLLEAEETARAIRWVLNEEVGEERVRKEVFQRKKNEAKGLPSQEVEGEVDRLEEVVEMRERDLREKRQAARRSRMARYEGQKDQAKFEEPSAEVDGDEESGGSYADA